VKLKNQKHIAIDVHFKAYPIVPPHVDPIWPDGSFKRSKTAGNISQANQLVYSCLYNNVLFTAVVPFVRGHGKTQQKVVFLFPTSRARIWSQGIDSEE
jgi:hypothetical protein